jgi:calcineurin-like phosphoesterase family protein
MAQVRFIADLHLSHANMAKRRGFASVEEHDAYLIAQWNSVVDKRDVTYILGDVTMEKSAPYPLLNKLNGKKHIVLGNHDRRQDTKKLFEYAESVAGMIQYKGIMLTHCPIHPAELEYRVPYNIHGHIHGKLVTYPVTLFGFKLFDRVDRRYFCVSCEHVDFKPKSLKDLGINR